MDGTPFDALGDRVLLTALSAVRVATMFLVLPIFSTETVPALVRNSLFVSIALLAVILQAQTVTEGLVAIDWIKLFLKEVLIGVSIGFLFGIFLWAFEAAGILIDTQIGSSFAMIHDPIVGNEVTLFGELLSRWAVWLFVAAGGLSFFVGAVLESFALWPLMQAASELRLTSVRLFEAAFEGFVVTSLMIAGPLLVLLFVVDLALGLVNRFAPQFNVFFLSTAIKSMAALAVVSILLPFLVDLLLDRIAITTDAIAVRLDILMEVGTAATGSGRGDD